MRNRIEIDHTHARAIYLEIGERLQASLREETELPANLGRQIDRLRELDGQSPSIVPAVERRLGNTSHRDARQGGRLRLWSWSKR
jgi:hypothetical protein